MVLQYSSPESLSMILRAELPAQVMSRRYGSYLFFDADMTSSDVMISAIRGLVVSCFGPDVEAEVFSSSTRSSLGLLSRGVEWSAEIRRLGKDLRESGDFGGMIVVDMKGRWVAYQSRPVDVGVVAIDSCGALNCDENLKNDFFDCADIRSWLEQRTARDIDLVQGFGVDFLTTLVKNYQ